MLELSNHIHQISLSSPSPAQPFVESYALNQSEELTSWRQVLKALTRLPASASASIASSSYPFHFLDSTTSSSRCIGICDFPCASTRNPSGVLSFFLSFFSLSRKPYLFEIPRAFSQLLSAALCLVHFVALPLISSLHFNRS